MNKGSNAADKKNNKMVTIKLLFLLSEVEFGNIVNAIRKDDTITISVNVPLTSITLFPILDTNFSEIT